ncbi:MAG: PilW family protein [Xanthomonadales bacterium]|nr:PilW family protein [Xanthomonadales bacterium]
MTFRSDSRQGFVLTELLVAVLMAAILMLGVVQMASATGRGLSLIESVSETQQSGRFAIDRMRDFIMSAGFHPTPWTEDAPVPGLSDESSDGGPGASDALVIRQWSNRNCFDLFNPALDGLGRPRFFLRISKFERTASDNLAQTCHYGPGESALVRQINREGLVQGVETFQVLYAEDTDGDRRANRLVRAGRWLDIAHVVGVELALLVASHERVVDAPPPVLVVLDEALSPPNDGRLRRVWRATVPMGARLR